MTLLGKKALILVDNLYQELEFWYPLLRLREEGAAVLVIGAKKGETYTSKLGYPVQSDLAAGDIKQMDFDALVIPGGYAPDIMRRYPEMVDLVRRAHEAGKVIAAICHAVWMLASAEIIRDRKVTCFFSIRDDVVHAGGLYRDAEVVVDGNIITSRIPDDLPAFLRAIIDALRS
ncbi:MAG TPA: type 1 glutamine amidotransferase domain-containing protein [Syntrophales bacterium]|jgi:protease I|nr:type 1 glutamine amidotransferase domain-containing protein [Syntrophales bacterium]HPI58210.1 type 1 glutamine amidotransferase domain-containing protein [Syntrophales bacterium]HPN25576.1 type 1 glutamine amidotransferase domain-containing protein [Syntrophales bacterium]HQM28166.1 type 1 glutamine amidotransferase domain-containing protein [Syntrophales bacterium]